MKFRGIIAVIMCYPVFIFIKAFLYIFLVPLWVWINFWKFFVQFHTNNMISFEEFLSMLDFETWY